MPTDNAIFHNVRCEPEFVISYECNLDVCPYCYARGQKSSDVMSVKDFGKMVGWFKEVVPSLDAVTIVGGEPTAVGNLEDYLDAVAQKQVLVNFFTNGSFSEDVVAFLKQSKAVKKLYFHLEPLHFSLILGHSLRFRKNIETLVSEGKDVRLRINFHGVNFDYELPLNVASQYGLPIAWSITSPCDSMNDYVRRKDMEQVGIRLGEFFGKAEGSGISLELVRPIPRCAFPEDIFRKHEGYANLGRHCNVSTYVHPNRVIQFCTVIDGIKAGPINSAEELRDGILQFQKVDPVIRDKPSFDVCPTCDHYKTKACQGGCLAYKMYGDQT